MTYMIQIDGHNVVNKTNSDNSTLNQFAHFLCTCGPHTVSISAVNICHRVGPSTSNVTLDPKPLSSSTCPARDVTTANATTVNVTTVNATFANTTTAVDYTADTSDQPNKPTGCNDNPKESKLHV